MKILIIAFAIPVFTLLYLYIKQSLKNKKLLDDIGFEMTTDEDDNINILIDHKLQINLKKFIFQEILLEKGQTDQIIQQTWDDLKSVILELNLWGCIERKIFEYIFVYSQDKNFKFSEKEISKFVSKNQD